MTQTVWEGWNTNDAVELRMRENYVVPLIFAKRFGNRRLLLRSTYRRGRQLAVSMPVL